MAQVADSRIASQCADDAVDVKILANDTLLLIHDASGCLLWPGSEDHGEKKAD
jgi:hypothetical protein